MKLEQLHEVKYQGKSQTLYVVHMQTTVEFNSWGDEQESTETHFTAGPFVDTKDAKKFIMMVERNFPGLRDKEYLDVVGEPGYHFEIGSIMTPKKLYDELEGYEENYQAWLSE